MAEGLYYTQQEFVDLFGEAEAIRITDETGTGVVDATAFTKAIRDVSADMDTYLAGRYALPFAAPIPRTLTSIAAALVREKLHTNFPTETVTRAADLARKQLRDLSTGLARLVLDTGAEPEPTAAGADGILISAPARVFTSTRLAQF